MTRPVKDLIREVLELDRAGQEQVFDTLLASLQASAPTLDGDPDVSAWEDPIVAEVHQIRQELLKEFNGDIDALAEDANRRLLNGEFGPRKIVSYPPRRPANWPGKQTTSRE